jgi:hypothetical protein
MVFLNLNCLICGCGWGDKVFTDTEFIKKHYTFDDVMHNEFGENLIENDVYDKKILEAQGAKVLKTFKYLPIHDWMKKIIVIQPGQIIDAILKTEDWYEVYDQAGNQYFFYSGDINATNYQKKAYIVHKKCYSLLKLHNYDVSYEAFAKIDDLKPIGPRRKKLSEPNIVDNRFKINYNIADKYIGEYGVFYQYVAYIWDPYILENPLKNHKNANRILNLKIPLARLLLFDDPDKNI